MAKSATSTVEWMPGKSVKKIVCQFVAGDGDPEDLLFPTSLVTDRIDGYIMRLTVTFGADALQPTDSAISMYFADSDGVPPLGSWETMTTSAPDQDNLAVPVFVQGPLTITVSGDNLAADATFTASFYVSIV